MSQPLLLSSLKRCYQSLDPSTYGSTIENLLGTLTSTPFPEEGPSPLSLQELALLSLLQDVVMAQCLLPCLLPPSLLRPTLYARFTRATPSLKALGVAGFEGAAEGILGGGVAKAEAGLAGVVQVSVALLSHPRMDARLVSKHGSEVVAGALALRRRGVGGPFTTLSTSLPTFTMAEALLSIASGRFCPELHAVLGSPEGAQAAAAEAAASASASPSSPVPPAQTPGASGAALRVSAAGELCRLCCTSPLGVESITRAMFATVDTGSAVSVDRVRQRLAGIFTTPPLEVATPGEYFGALGPQLLGMLRLGGIGGGGKGGSGGTASSHHPPRRPPTTPASSHHLAVDTAALTLAFLLKICGREHPPSPHASAIWEGVFAPMLAPLTDYIAPTTTTTTTAAGVGGVVSVAAPSHRPLLPCGGAMVHNEDAVLGCAEDLHKVLSLAPPSPGASALLTPVLPALLDLYTAYSRGAKLRVGAASAAREVFGRVLGGCVPHVGARVCGMMLGLPKRGFLDKFLKEGTAAVGAAGAAAGGIIDPTVSAPLRSVLLLERDPTKAYVLGDNAGYALAQFPGPVTRSGVSLEEGGGLPSPTLLLGGRGKSGSGRNGGSGIGGGAGGGLMASLMSISSPSLSSSSSSSSSSSTSAPFGGLREIGGGTAGGGSVGGVAGLGGIGGKDTPHSEDLGGINNPSAQESGERANALVDILGALPTKRQPRGGGESGGGRSGGGSTVSGVLFSALLGWQAAHFLSPQRQRRQQQQQQQQGLGLVVVVAGGGEKEEEIEIEEGGVIPALQLAVCLSERLGPRLLQGDVECTIAVRHTLCLAVLSTGLPLPGPEEVGCGREGAAIHREATAAYTAASTASAVVGGAGEGGVNGASSNPDTEELIATCLGLLTVLLTSEEEEEGGEGGGGGNKGDKPSPSTPPAPNKEAWLRSTLPLLAALASYPSEELAETATALRALILTRPMPSSAGGSGGGNGGSTSSSTPSTTSNTSGAANLLKSQGQQQQQQQQQPPRLSLQDAMGLVMDPEPAVLSHGLRALADAVAKGDTATTTTTTTNSTATVSALLELSLRNLPSHDSYVYLAAMELLGALATYHGPSTLPLLLRAYSGAGGGGSNTAAGGATAAAAAAAAAAPPLPPRVRVKLGEVLCRATASAGKGGVLPVYAGALLGCLLAVGPGGWREQEVLVARLQAAVASSSPLGGDAQEKEEGGGEEEEEEMEQGNEKKASGGTSTSTTTTTTTTTTTSNSNNNNNNNNTPLPPKAMAFFPPGTSQRDTWDPYNIALALRDCGEVRASALSTLGEVGGYLGASLATHAGDIVGGVCGVLSMERPGSVLKGWGGKKGGGSGGDSSVDLVVEVAAGVRRAAAVAVRRLVEGGGAFVTLAGRGYARELVGVMRGAGEGDEDERVRVHARDALGVVEEAMEKLWGGAT